MAQQKTEKIRQRELRQPDAFQKAGADARDWLMQRQKLLAIAAGVLVVGAVGVAIGSEVSKRGEEKATQGLGQALAVLDRPVTGVDAANPSDTEPPFKSVKEKDEAVVKSLTDFRKEHGGTRAATTAALPLGKAEFRLGNFDNALTAFGDFLKSAAPTDPLRASAFEGQGYAYEAKGDHAKAIESFSQMDAADSGEYLAGMGQYHKARMLILDNKKEEAAQVLSKIPTDHPNSAAARQATERLAVLSAEGVKVPAPTPAATTTQDAG
ncbi:tetratricopeptide repeat protein [Corallococcus sp. H22C18031201]|uniref:tetratricopeptide repeat protein n=1 Tax=Citreicoccus inhibens TaxID=2849499 RepID=UPI000E77376C|nr:tetratricopeptide repeat protein [Citreicoccus inhibens]MBU8894757.1 tetratricopeptide repeat protein [Citreicoccus inhibens]RJS17730.1 tetratricopeptide repeat protein [Corallococcus sp. H22C18031201]